MLSFNDLLEATGLTRNQFKYLRRLGFIPDPIRGGTEEWGGSRYLYPDTTVDVIEWVRAKREEGLTLHQARVEFEKTRLYTALAGDNSAMETLATRANPDVDQAAAALWAAVEDALPNEEVTDIWYVPREEGSNIRVYLVRVATKPRE